jgi:hypothetical protein
MTTTESPAWTDSPGAASALGAVSPSARETLSARATGAELREIVRRGVLEHGADLTTDALVELVGTAQWKPTVSTGQYL